MRRFSRWMPPAPVRKTPIWAWPLLLLCLFGIIYVIYRGYPYSLIILGVIGVVVCVHAVLEARHMRSLAAERTDESICTFVRSFDYRRTDSWLLRAVYEELSRYSAVDGRPLPIRADDRLEEDLKIDPEDFEDFTMVDIAHRAGRSLDDTKHNPLYGKVMTVRDVVNFFEHQSRIEVVEQVGHANGSSLPC
jgi:hypothetical protein